MCRGPGENLFTEAGISATITIQSRFDGGELWWEEAVQVLPGSS